MKKIIPAQTGQCFNLKKNQLLKVTDPEGQQVADLFCFGLQDQTSILSGGRSIDYADTIYLTQGHDLYSNQSEVMLRIIEDTCGRHDFLMTPCSLKMFQIVTGNKDYHPSCLENLAKGFQEYGISEHLIGTTFNIFMNVAVKETGPLQIESPLSKPGDYIIFQAQMDLIIGLTACSHEETNAHKCKPIMYEIIS